MLRSAMFGLSMFLMCFMFAVVPLTGCGDNNKTTEKSDEATTDASTPTEQNTGFRTCEPGEKINDCQGSGDCKAERDCDRLRGYEQAGMCFDNMCGMTPKKQDATIQKDKKRSQARLVLLDVHTCTSLWTRKDNTLGTSRGLRPEQ